MKNLYALVFCMFAVIYINGQTIINLNDTSVPVPDEMVVAQRQVDSWFKDGVRVRPFHLNPQISNHQNLQDGNQIILQLFDDKSHPATILRKFTDINGVTTLTLKLNAYQYAFAYIALSPDSYLVTVDIPEENEKYSSRSGLNQPQAYMFQLDETHFHNLKCGVDDEVHDQAHGKGKAVKPQIQEGITPLPNVPVYGTGPVTMNTGCHTMPNINDPATISILIAYTPAAESWANTNQGGISNVIGLTLANANQVSVNNNLGINFQLAHSPLVNYTEVDMASDLYNLLTEGNGYMDEVHDLRKVHNVDLVALLNYPTTGGGIATGLTSKYGNNKAAFSATRVIYAANTNIFIHEIGHNMGANHNPYQSFAPGPTNWENWSANTWSAGWRWQGTDNNYYADLMSYTGNNQYADGFPTSTIPYFSDPSHTHMGGVAGDPVLGDNARTLREIKHFVARYKETIGYCGAGNAPLYHTTNLYIDNVTIGVISNPSGASSARYGDFTALTTCMMPGDTQTLEISIFNSSSTRPVKVWIDWNDDKIFDPATELVYDSGTGSPLHNVTITAPLGVYIGDKRMRIRTYSTFASPVVDTPCGYSGIGEVEDYTIRLEAAPPCSVAAVPQNFQVSDVTNNTATISWDSESGIDYYELQYRETGAVVWNTITPVVYPFYTLIGLDLLTEYEVQIRAVCNGTPSAYSASLVFTTSSHNYCTSTSNSVAEVYIKRVELNTIDNISADENGGYSDFTNISTNLQQGQTYTITITPERVNNTYGIGYSVWIDYNFDGAFDGPNERVGGTTTSISSALSESYTFTVPYGVVPGPTLVRVTARQGNHPRACEIFPHGEVEDYTVVLGANPPCTAATIPTNLSLQGTTSTSASLYWDGVAGASYDLRYKLISDSNWTTLSDLEFREVTLEGLLLSQEYEAQVRSKCDGGATSAYSNSLMFFVDYEYCEAMLNGGFLIERVRLSNIDNSSSNNTGYSNFTHIVGEIQLGTTYTITVNNNGGPFGRAYAAYIDYNYDGIFDVSTELVWSQTSTFDLEVSGSITVPMGIDLNRVRLRIVLYATGSSTYIPPPCIVSSAGGEVEDYTIVLTPPGYTFQDGSWTPENPVGVSTVNDDIRVINGTAVLNGDLQANSISISAGATLSTEHTITLNGDIENDGLLLFNSNASSTGQLNTFTGSITGSGLVTVERYIPARRAFRFLSTPVTTTGSIRDNWQEGVNNLDTSSNQDPTSGFGTHITGSTTGANGFDATVTGNPSLFTLNNTTQSWVATPNTNLDGLVHGKAYRLMVRGDRSIDVTNNSATPTNTTLRATGVLWTGPYSVLGLSETENHFNFIGNPYPAAVDMNNVIVASTNVNPAFYYIWNPNMGTRGAYVTVELPQGTNTSGLPGNQYLQPGQAAFVSTLANGAASLQFEETHKNVAEPLTAVFSIDSRIDIRLYRTDAFTAGNPASDGLRLKFGEDQTNAITSMDAPKFFNQDENLASSNDDRQWSIENRALPIPGESITLFTNQYRTTDYIFEVDLTELNAINALLKDNFTGNTTELDNNQNTLYAFTVNPDIPESIAANRFEIVFEKLLSTVDISFGIGFVLYPNPTEGGFTIVTRGISGDIVMVSIANVLGQILYDQKHTIDAGGQLFVDANILTQGVYIVKLTDDNGEKHTIKLMKN